MSNATGPRPTKKQHSPYLLRIWRCGFCNVACKTVLAPGGLCSVCRTQPSLPGVDDRPSRSEDRGGR